MRYVLVGSFMAALLLLAPAATLADPLLLAGIGRGSATNRGAVITVNETTGAGALVGPGAGPNAGLTGLAFDASGALFGSTISNPVFTDPAPGSPTLVRLDATTGQVLLSVPITFSGTPLEITDLAAQPGTGTLYGVLPFSLYTINKTTGVATLVGNLAVISATIAFAPDGTLYGTSADFDAAGNQTGSFLHRYDPATGALLSTVDLAQVGGNFVHVGGLAVRPTDGVIFASARLANQDRVGNIYRLTPSGTVTLVGSTGAGEVGDLDFTPIPEPTTLVLFGTGLAGVAARLRRRRKS